MPKKVVYLFALIFFLLFHPSAFAATVVINEFLANQSSGQDEWVEFYNPDHLDLAEYWIDDDTDFGSDSGNSSKKQLTAVSLNVANSTFPYVTLSSLMFNDTCSSSCDYVVLFSADGSIIDQFQYTSEMIEQEGKTIGRSPDGTGDMVILASMTQGAPNSQAEPSPSSIPTPTPTPAPTPTPTPTKSPTPTPKTTPTSILTKSPSPTPKNSPAVLGETQDSLQSPTEESTPSPSANPTSTSPSKTKIAAILTGSGAILIGFSVGFYLWYNKVLARKEEDQNQPDEKESN